MTSNFFAWGPVCQNEVDSKEEKQPEATESCSVEFFQIWPQKARLLNMLNAVWHILIQLHVKIEYVKIGIHWVRSLFLRKKSLFIYVFWLMLIGGRDSQVLSLSQHQKIQWIKRTGSGAPFASLVLIPLCWNFWYDVPIFQFFHCFFRLHKERGERLLYLNLD